MLNKFFLIQIMQCKNPIKKDKPTIRHTSNQRENKTIKKNMVNNSHFRERQALSREIISSTNKYLIMIVFDY